MRKLDAFRIVESQINIVDKFQIRVLLFGQVKCILSRVGILIAESYFGKETCRLKVCARAQCHIICEKVNQRLYDKVGAEATRARQTHAPKELRQTTRRVVYFYESLCRRIVQ